MRKFLIAPILVPLLMVSALAATTYHVREKHHFTDGTWHYDRADQVAVSTTIACGFAISSGTRSYFVIERTEATP